MAAAPGIHLLGMGTTRLVVLFSVFKKVGKGNMSVRCAPRKSSSIFLCKKKGVERPLRPVITPARPSLSDFHAPKMSMSTYMVFCSSTEYPKDTFRSLTSQAHIC